MKKSITFIIIVLFSMEVGFSQVSPGANGVSPTITVSTPVMENPPMFGWLEETHDFGSIPQGIPVTHRFQFTNTGKSDLIVSDVKKSCGCTNTDWSKVPVPPGGTGFVEATFNAGVEGNFTKTITVTSNTAEPTKVLYFTGVVFKQDDSMNLNNNTIISAPPVNESK